MESWMALDAWRHAQNEAFLDLADKCEICGTLYVEDSYAKPEGCPHCK